MTSSRLRRAGTALSMIALFGAAIGTSTAVATPSQNHQVDQNLRALQSQRAGNAWSALSVSARQQIQQEFNAGKMVFTVTRGSGVSTSSKASRLAKKAYSGCWSRAVEGIFYGGVTNRKMFGVGQRTQVCVKKGKVKTVKVISPYKLEFGRIGFTVKEPTTGAYNASWEGRGVARVDAVFGISIPGVGDIGARKTICAKLYLNGNGHDVRSTGECYA